MLKRKGQCALLQLLSHLPSLSDDNTTFLFAFGGRKRMNLHLKLIPDPLCTLFYIAG